MFTFLLTVAEEVTKYTDIATNVVQNNWAQILGWISIPTVATMLIGRVWASVSSAINRKKIYKANVKIQDTITSAVTTLQGQTDQLSSIIVSNVKSGFEEISKTNLIDKEKTSALQNKIVSAIVEKNDTLKSAFEDGKAIANSKVQELAEEVSVKVEEVKALGDGVVKALSDKAVDIQDKATDITGKLERVVKKSAKKVKQKVQKTLTGFDR